MWSRLYSTDNYKQSCQLRNHVEMPSLNLRGFSRSDLEFFLVPLETITLTSHISSWRDYKTTKHVTVYAPHHQSMRGPSITWMLIYCCRRGNLLPLAVVKSTTPVQVLYLPSVPCDGPLTYPDSTTDSSLFGTALEIQYVSLTSMRAICALRFGVEQYTFIRDGTKLAYCAPDLGLRIRDIAALMDEDWHSAHGYELRLQGMADVWVMGRDNGLLFWVSVEHRNMLYVQPSQSGNRDIPKEGNECGPIQLRAWQKVSGMDWQRAVERAKGEGGKGVAGVGNQSVSCPQLKYLEVLRRSGELERRTSFMSSLVSSSFCSSLASQVCLNDLFRKCIRQSSYRENPEQHIRACTLY